MRIILLTAGIAALCCAAEARPAWRDSVVADARLTGLAAERLVTAPARAGAVEWLAVGGLAAGAGLAAMVDADVRRTVLRLDDEWATSVDGIGHAFQQTELFFAATGAFYIGGHAAGSPAMRRVGQELALAFAVAAAGTQVVKHTAGRTRPDQDGADAGTFVGPTISDSHQSLWSGDVTKAFVLASVLSAEAQRPVVTVLLYGLASATAFQRIHSDRHWFSDVVSAAVWSTAVGIGTVRATKRQRAKALGMQLTPTGLVAQW